MTSEVRLGYDALMGVTAEGVLAVLTKARLGQLAMDVGLALPDGAKKTEQIESLAGAVARGRS
jgi:hypothetical protein